MATLKLSTKESSRWDWKWRSNCIYCCLWCCVLSASKNVTSDIRENGTICSRPDMCRNQMMLRSRESWKRENVAISDCCFRMFTRLTKISVKFVNANIFFKLKTIKISFRNFENESTPSKFCSINFPSPSYPLFSALSCVQVDCLYCLLKSEKGTTGNLFFHMFLSLHSRHTELIEHFFWVELDFIGIKQTITCWGRKRTIKVISLSYIL